MTERRAHLELIRLISKGDGDSYRRHCAHLDAEGWEGFGEVVGAAFFLAADRAFGTNVSTAEVIRFVADARAEIQDTGFDLDPRAAETLILAAKTGKPDALEKLDQQTIIENEMLLLWKFLEDLDDTGLDSFLNEVEALVEQWSRDAQLD
ncbi:hypothetical protein [Plantactinospora sp. WMMB782]|uniref:hypothetical protein n=1 Tax=Plantactinospora sp. WMMB782 TaxID=3404121 RepID=UPI003B96478C